MNEAESIQYHKTHDVAIIQIGRVSGRDKKQPLEFFDGVKLKEKTKSGFLGVNIENTKNLDDVLTGNEVFIFGYPMSLGMEEIPQLDHTRPLLRKGIVAGKNKTLKTIILDCPGYKGNSGGPVVEAEEVELGKTKFTVIGVVSQFVPSEQTLENKTHGYSDTTTIMLNSGYSVAIPMEKVKELLWKE